MSAYHVAGDVSVRRCRFLPPRCQEVSDEVREGREGVRRPRRSRGTEAMSLLPARALLTAGVSASVSLAVRCRGGTCPHTTSTPCPVQGSERAPNSAAPPCTGDCEYAAGAGATCHECPCSPGQPADTSCG